MLTAYARSKQRRLGRDRTYVEQQVKLLIENGAMSEALIEEPQAQARLRDPRSDRMVELTPEFFCYSTTPVSPESDRIVNNRVVLVGRSPLDRRTAGCWLPCFRA